MAISQNARFSGEAIPDAECEHPPGASIARLLKDALAKQGWAVSDIENWRDCGWWVTCYRPTSELQLVITKIAVESDWFLQIAPSYVPGLLGWILKKPASAGSEAIQALAQDTFSVLWQTGRFREFMWSWNGYPEEGSSTPEPVPAETSS